MFFFCWLNFFTELLSISLTHCSKVYFKTFGQYTDWAVSWSFLLVWLQLIQMVAVGCLLAIQFYFCGALLYILLYVSTTVFLCTERKDWRDSFAKSAKGLFKLNDILYISFLSAAFNLVILSESCMFHFRWKFQIFTVIFETISRWFSDNIHIHTFF